MQRNFTKIKNLFLEFIIEQQSKSPYEIVGLINDKNGVLITVKLEGRFVKNMTPQQIILDDDMVDCLTPKTVRAITYLAVIEGLSPDLHMVKLELDEKLKEYFVTIKNKNKSFGEKVSASEISKNNSLIKKLTAEDANRIGYMAGINDTIKEFEHK